MKPRNISEKVIFLGAEDFDRRQLKKLAFLLKFDSAESLLDEIRRYTQENRRRFDRLFDEALHQSQQVQYR